MILQYCLSVYAINFFTSPSFTAFKIRLINQQNGDCNDSPLLDARSLGATNFPVPIKLKGGERLLMKVKVISVAAKEKEIVMGQGVVNFDRDAIDSSLRVPIYDKKQGIEEVAICSIDFFISGHSLNPNNSGALDKSISRAEDWRDRTEDAVFSQMSYTVESENEHEDLDAKMESQTVNAEKRLDNKLKINKQISPLKQDAEKKKYNTKIEKDSVSNEESSLKQKKIRQEIQAQYPLQNTAYLSQSPSKMTKTTPRGKGQKQSSKLPNIVKPIKIQHTHQHLKYMVFPNTHSGILQDRDQDETMSPQQIRKVIKQQENLAHKLKKYLNRSQQRYKNNSQELKLTKNKVRRRDIKIQQVNSFKLHSNYLKYYQQFSSNDRRLLQNVRAFKGIQNQIKESLDYQTIQIPINKIMIAYNNLQKILVFDSLGYRSYCITNYLKQSSIGLKIPYTQQGLRVTVILNNNKQFEAVIGVQQGENMLVRLVPREKNTNNSVLIKQFYKLSFDIKQENSPIKLLNAPRQRENQMSFREPLVLSSPTSDIRSRIEAFSIQPWGYGHSYLTGLKRVDQTVNTAEKNKGKSMELSDSKSLIQKRNSPLNMHSKNSIKKIIVSDKKSKTSDKNDKKQKTKEEVASQQDKKQDKIPTRHFYISQNDQSSMEQRDKQKKQSKRQSRKIPVHGQKKQISQINNIRNGNRNNYRFKQKQDDKKPNIKEMWQRLLIKKKTEQEQIQSNNLKKRKRQQSSLYSSKISNPLKQESFGRHSDEQQTPSKLYGILPGTSQVMKVHNQQRAVLDGAHLSPVRTISFQINNISITQPQAIIEQELGQMVGKFIKLTVKDRMTYYTQIIFNGQFNSILWKLSGCFFGQLTGNELLEIQIYSTVQNKITLIGKSKIRISKIYFLRNNHIYNGKIINNKILNGQFTLGYEVQEHYPFQVIEEEVDDHIMIPAKQKINHIQKPRRSQPSILRRKPVTTTAKSISELKQSSLSQGKFMSLESRKKYSRNSNGSVGWHANMKSTLKRQFNQNKKDRQNAGNDSAEITPNSEFQYSNILPNGLQQR